MKVLLRFKTLKMNGTILSLMNHFCATKIFLEAFDFSNGFGRVIILYDNFYNSYKYNFITKSGKYLSKNIFSQAEDFNTYGLARVNKSCDKLDNKWNFLKSDGSFLSSDNFYYAHDFLESNIALIQKYCFK